MDTMTKKKIAFICTYPPRKCGIGTFSKDLIDNIKLAAGENFEPLVVAVEAGSDHGYSDPVKFEIRRNVKNDYASAADYINFSDVDAISIQHEFGLFGGDAGSYLNILLSRVNLPVYTTLHTVLNEPDPPYYKSTLDICNASHKVIVMNKRGVDMLKNIYGIPEEKIILIPHGIPDLTFVDSNYYKGKFGMENRKTILTFGLLSRNKGIEFALKALPEVVKADPSVLYVVLGMTHPEVKKFEGESYRFELQRMVKELGLQENVIFHNRFVVPEELHSFLCAADLYLTPYLNVEQLTSGTLAYAVGTGKAVISTPYWAAEELLADDRGVLVDFGKHKQLSNAIIDLIHNDTKFYNLRRRAYEYGRNIIWPEIGKKYLDLFSQPQKKMIGYGFPVKPEPEISIMELPEPPLAHLRRLTDSTGLYQHANFIVPNRNHGYCTDDNARAVVVMRKYNSQYHEPDAARLFDTYLSFTMHAQNPDGTVRNFMQFDRNWLANEPQNDSLGRTLWAFGSVIASPPTPAYLSIIKSCFDRSIKHVTNISPRAKAYAAFGMNDYLSQFPGASDIKRYFNLITEDLINIYKTYSTKDWQWFEEILAYDNAVLPQALFLAYQNTGNQQALEIAVQTANFLLENTFDGDKFSFVGCNGWHTKGRKRAQFDQQPLEVASTILMLKSAYDITRNKTYLSLQKRAFDWFLGENDLGISLYDFKTKGCCDGLEAGGVNLNQGAESILSFLLSLLCVIESYSAQSIEPGLTETNDDYTILSEADLQQEGPEPAAKS